MTSGKHIDLSDVNRNRQNRDAHRSKAIGRHWPKRRGRIDLRLTLETLAAVAVAMIAVALAASWVPACRASRTDAMEALRHD
jgi:ABC-type lipoprotein release transport system permease subunit